jgi:hypothetical protein
LFRREDHVSRLHSRDRGQKNVKAGKLHHREVLANYRFRNAEFQTTSRCKSVSGKGTYQDK